MDEDIRNGSFRMPSWPQMPLLTSIPWGLRVERASEAFSGFIPPAKSHPCLLLILGRLNRVQLNLLPLHQAIQWWNE